MRIYALQRTVPGGPLQVTLTRTLKPHTTPVVITAVDRTSTLLATGGTDGVIKVWDIAGGYVTHTFRGPSVLVSALHFFEVAACINKDNTEAGHRRKAKPNGNIPTERDQENNNFRLASGSQTGNVRIWDLHKRDCAANLDSHVSDVQALDYSATEHTLVSASRDKTITWWDTRSWKIRRVVPCLEVLEAAGFLNDGALTYSAGANGYLRIWNTATGSELTPKESPRSEEEAIVAAIFRPEIPYIICVQSDHTIALYQPPTLESLSVAHSQVPIRRISGTHDEIIDVAYVLPDRSVLALATNSEDVRLIAAQDGKISSSQNVYAGQDIALLRGHEDIVIALDVDWSGHWIASASKDNTARLWQVDFENNSFICWATFSGHAESLGAAALPRTIPDDSSPAWKAPLEHPPPYLLTGSQDQTIKKWDIPKESPLNSRKASSRAIFTRKAHDKDINTIAIHHAGLLFASASQDKTVKIWSTEEGEVQGILRGHKRGVWSIQFSPSQMPAVQGEEGSVSGKGVVLTGSGDKTVKLWSLTDYSCLRTFESHSQSVLKVAWLSLPVIRSTKKPIQFVSAGGDGLVKIWDANSGELECTLDNHEDRVWALAVHPQTNMIVSGSGDSTLTFWKDTSAETQAAASQAALQLVEQEQKLQNHIRVGSYREAITLALQLNHPGRLLNLFTSVVTNTVSDKGSLTGSFAVDDVLADLSDEQIFLLLLRLRDWNTNARTAPVAQRILLTLLRSYPASKFSNLSVKGAKGKQSLTEILDGLKVYTERHYRRIEDLVDESFLVEYTLQEMDNLAPLPRSDHHLVQQIDDVGIDKMALS